MADECGRQLRRAADDGDLVEVERLIREGVNVEAADSDGFTALLWASMKGHKDIVELLLASGAQPDKENTYGRTALLCASASGHKDVVEVLLASGAQPDKEDDDGKTAWMFASDYGHSQITDLLAAKGASADASYATNVSIECKDTETKKQLEAQLRKKQYATELKVADVSYLSDLVIAFVTAPECLGVHYSKPVLFIKALCGEHWPPVQHDDVNDLRGKPFIDMGEEGFDVKKIAERIVDYLRKKKALSKKVAELVADCTKEGAAGLAATPITFGGSEVFRAGEICIVSFPGKYSKAWNLLTDEIKKSNGNFSTATVFLPSKESKGYGEHVDHSPGHGECGWACWWQLQGKCYCKTHIREGGLWHEGFEGDKGYSADKGFEWGCYWFKLWRENVAKAVAANARLVVIYFDTFPEDTPEDLDEEKTYLGRSQIGEVKYLRDAGYAFERQPVRKLARIVLGA